ncbi:alpha/beta hydrolase family protein [Sphingomonas sp.]
MRFEPRAGLAMAAAAMLSLAGCAQQAARTPPGPQLAVVEATDARPARAETLLVFVHDDTTGALPDRDAFLRQAAQAIGGRVAAVRVVRPGYAAPDGRVSPGTRDAGIGDGYGRDAVEALGRTIRNLRGRNTRLRTILIGEGGGAALVANLAGVDPGALDAMLLVRCPCTLPEWRSLRARSDARFRQPVQSLDPVQVAGGIAPTLRAAIVVGEKDAVMLPRFSRTYAEALALRGIATDFRRLPSRGSDALDDPETIQALVNLVRPRSRS